jgi:hypothetical protein
MIAQHPEVLLAYSKYIRLMTNHLVPSHYDGHFANISIRTLQIVTKVGLELSNNSWVVLILCLLSNSKHPERLMQKM